MTNNITKEEIRELLEIQKKFDDRIPTLNLQDSKVAYVVEFFEWFNTLETFKNWKKKPGKPLDVQLDELSDMLAFGLSITNQLGSTDKELKNTINIIDNNFNFSKSAKSYMEDICSNVYHDWATLENYVYLPLALGKQFYDIDQLIKAYKKKMEVNHARQDGTADTEKGYI